MAEGRVAVSAKTLQKAATLMRERAAAATPGPWWPHRDDAEMIWYGDEQLTYRLDMDPDAPDADWDAWEKSTGQLSHGNLQRAEDAAHIASWPPAVAFAVADWLDVIAERWGQPGHRDWHGPEKAALAVASTYLGKAA